MEVLTLCAGALVVGVARLLWDQLGGEKALPATRQFLVQPFSNSSLEVSVTRDIDIIYCRVGGGSPGTVPRSTTTHLTPGTEPSPSLW